VIAALTARAAALGKVTIPRPSIGPPRRAKTGSLCRRVRSPNWAALTHNPPAGPDAPRRRALGVGGAPTASPVAVVHGRLRRLAAELAAHFDREERQLVSALNAL